MCFVIPVLEFVNEGTPNDTLASMEMGSGPTSIPRPLRIDSISVFVRITMVKEALFPDFFLSTSSTAADLRRFDKRVLFTFVFPF